MQSKKALTYHGIDGCRYGWIMVSVKGSRDQTSPTFSVKVDASFSVLLSHVSLSDRVLVDIPVGLADGSRKEYGKRPCDLEARKMLGKKRSSVFSPPCMEALYEKSYEQACTRNLEVLGKKFSIQAWNIVPKIREVNAFLHLNPAWRNLVLEAHPELAFAWLNQGKVLSTSKKTREGFAGRMDLIEERNPGASAFIHTTLSQTTHRGKFAPDDLLDAMALALLNFSRGDALQNISDQYPEDSLGNRMGIWI